MCHRWLAAGVVAFVLVVLNRELGPVLRERAPSDTSIESGLLGSRLRDWFRNRLRPLADAFIGFGISPDTVTLSQGATSVVCGLAYARGWMFTAGWLLITCGSLDVLDGEMARRQHRDGPRGAFIDSVVDRYGESAVYLGLVAFYRDTWVLWAVLSAWAGAFFVSYTRARAEGLGIPCREGLLQRPERYVLLAATSMISPLACHLACRGQDRHELIAAGICVLAILANFTALQRARGTLRKLA
jgi:CDP-diacylglycerol--glycerol-3-phosphate 3-phosphatidyltransferase